MQNFSYAKPHTIDEAIGILSEHGSSARLLAGGTDLIIKMRAGALSPGMVIDTKHIPELSELSLTEDGLLIGAAVSCRTIYEHPEIIKSYPALVDSTSLIGGIQIQGRASLGGNLCNAAPSADIIPTLIALGAEAQISGPGGDRSLPVEEFCTGPSENVLEEREMLVNVKIPAPQKNSGARFLRFIPRNEMDIAVANSAASVVLNPAGDQFVSARIAIGAVAPTPLFIEEAGNVLANKSISDENIHEAAMIAMNASQPINDMRGTVEHRKQLVKVLTVKAIHGAIDRAKGN